MREAQGRAKAFIQQLGPSAGLKALASQYQQMGFVHVAERLRGLELLVQLHALYPDSKVYAAAKAGLDAWIDDLVPFEHRAGHEQGQRLLSVLRLTSAALAKEPKEVKESKAKDFFKQLPSYLDLERLAADYRTANMHKTAAILADYARLLRLAKTQPEVRKYCKASLGHFLAAVSRSTDVGQRHLAAVLRKVVQKLPEARRAKDFVKSLRPVRKEDIDDMVQGYLNTALATSTDDYGEPLHTVEHPETGALLRLSDDVIPRMRSDCLRFYIQNRDAIESSLSENAYLGMRHVGGDFWLTRNGHGAGFWDGDWPEERSKRLTAACKKFGEVDLYIGDDNLIYHYPP